MLEMAGLVVFSITLAIALWAFVDCLIRPAAAFPAVQRQTKSAWLIFLGLAVVVEVLFGGISLLGIAGVVLSAYYLVDVRAKVLAVTRR